MLRRKKIVQLFAHYAFFSLQDRFLPIANVARIMKNAIPKSGKVQFFFPLLLMNTLLNCKIKLLRNYLSMFKM